VKLIEVHEGFAIVENPRELHRLQQRPLAVYHAGKDQCEQKAKGNEVNEEA